MYKSTRISMSGNTNYLLFYSYTRYLRQIPNNNIYRRTVIVFQPAEILEQNAVYHVAPSLIRYISFLFLANPVCFDVGRKITSTSL